MRQSTLICFAVLLFPSITYAPPAPKVSRPPITVENVDRIQPIGELQKDVWDIVPGPVRGEIALVYWEKPVEIVDTQTIKVMRTLLEKHKPVHFAASPDGKWMAWSENNTRVVLQEIAGEKKFDIETKNSQSRPVFSPDSKTLVTGGYGTKAKVWDLDGKLIRELDCGGAGGLRPVFSPDGKLLAVGNRNHETMLFNTADGKLIHSFPVKMTQEIEFSPDGKTLAAGYCDGTVAIWDVATGKMLGSAATGAAEVYTVAWNPKGDLLATAGNNGPVVIWEAKKLTKLRELDGPKWCIRVRFTPDGSRFFTSGGSENSGKQDRKVTFWAAPERND